MKKFFLHDGTQQQGPFDIDDLKTKNLSRDSHIWYEGLSAWTTAGSVDELKSLFSATPPPISQPVPPPLVTEASSKKAINTKTGWGKWVVLGIAIVIISLLLSSVTEGLAIPFIVVAVGIYFIWKYLGGLKIFSILSIIVSLAGIIAGFTVAYMGIDVNLGTITSRDTAQLILIFGYGIIIYSIYFLVYAVSVVASVRKNKVGQLEAK